MHEDDAAVLLESKQKLAGNRSTYHAPTNIREYVQSLKAAPTSENQSFSDDAS